MVKIQIRGKVKLYLNWLTSMNFSPETVITKRRLLSYFCDWAEARDLYDLRDITYPVLDRYRYYLSSGQGRERPLKAGTQRGRLTAIKEYFKWLTRERYLLYNPAFDLELPRTGSPLPSAILSVKEVETVLQCINIDIPSGKRDRAMFEVLYSTGIRRKELCSLKLSNIDLDRGLVMIREGKGNKDRLIPIGERAISWIYKYLQEVRDLLITDASEDMLFLTSKGPMKPSYLSILGHRYLKRSGLNKPGACHIYRHTMATLMLEGGADIRHVQEMLGHASLESTQLYTRVAVRKLKDVHSSTHPGAKLQQSATEKSATEKSATEKSVAGKSVFKNKS